MERRYVLSVLVENKSGALARISGMFSRRGYNIVSLTVGETLDPSLSRMTIELYGDAHILEQIHKQLAKLIEVKKITEVDVKNAVFRELMLVKVRVRAGDRANIVGICNVFGATIADLSPTTATIETTNSVSKNNSLLEVLKDYGVLEVARTGIAALQLGETVL